MIQIDISAPNTCNDCVLCQHSDGGWFCCGSKKCRPLTRAEIEECGKIGGNKPDWCPIIIIDDK